MKRRQATTLLNGQRTRGNDAARHEQRARVAPPERVIEQSTPLPGRQMKDAWGRKEPGTKREKQRGAGKTLRTSTGTVVGSEAIGQKIIGRGIRVGDGGFRCGRQFRSEDRDLALANHNYCASNGGRISIEPLIAGAPASEGGRYRSKALPTRRSFVDSELATWVLVVKR